MPCIVVLRRPMQLARRKAEAQKWRPIGPWHSRMMDVLALARYEVEFANRRDHATRRLVACRVQTMKIKRSRHPASPSCTSKQMLGQTQGRLPMELPRPMHGQSWQSRNGKLNHE